MKEEIFEKSIRPLMIDDYVGQSKIKENLKVFIKAAKMRDESLDHTLLYGSPGLGKTTLAHIIANEMGVNIKTCSVPSIEKAGDLAAILSTLEAGDVLFVDEIHRIPTFVEEILYSAMEDFYLDIIINSDGRSRNIKIDLPPFTLVGATTRVGNLSNPLRDRFGIVCKLELYSDDELKKIVKRTSEVLEVEIDEKSCLEIAKRSRKTPRIANRIFKRIEDFAIVEGRGKIDLSLCKKSLKKLEIDNRGLNNIDRAYLENLIKIFGGGPVGIDTLASSIGEESKTLEDVVEPFLLQERYIKRSSRGRVALEKSYEHLKYLK